MAWTNPAPEVTAFRDALLATTTIGTTIGVNAAASHYPSADPTTDALPLLMIDTSDLEGQRDTSGGSILVGKFEGTLLLPSTVDVGTAEQYRYLIARELVEWMSECLAITRVKVSRAQLPSPGMQAASDAGQPDTGVAYMGLVIEAWFEG